MSGVGASPSISHHRSPESPTARPLTSKKKWSSIWLTWSSEIESSMLGAESMGPCKPSWPTRAQRSWASLSMITKWIEPIFTTRKLGSTCFARLCAGTSSRCHSQTTVSMARTRSRIPATRRSSRRSMPRSSGFWSPDLYMCPKRERSVWRLRKWRKIKTLKHWNV